MKVEREVSFSAEEVRDWCDQAGYSNGIHLSEQEAADSVFGERVVPGMMILDQVSGLVERYGSIEGEYAILANVVACRFRDPIPLDEEVTISVKESDSDNSFTYLDFEARTWDELAVHGTVGVVIK